MKAFKLKYEDDRIEIVYGKSTLEVIKRYDLAGYSNRNTRISELEGEQLAIALANLEYQTI